ncbi:hypothetical protein K2173_009562 [Erythroxylum novogranatense]|uniref:SNRNP25 ubiquitin-like domain-containing protein n=1 Tax=Erythroxylum novogranatense TaxID=1862640 RepID=A0AAV8U4A3_9ROSI|nr:hypothetical protein K2173_009562 [Erythroxylum novogranatense]
MSKSGNLRVFIEKRSHSYRKLPKQLLSLSILKLDGSHFEIQIGRNATVSELRQAVEEIFTSSPKEGEPGVLWDHVWRHFCLCYQGQKLINDKACIKNFGIKDGDQLQFIRHLTINYSPSRKQLKNQGVAYKPYSPGEHVDEKKEQKPSADNIEKKEEMDNNTKNTPQEEIHISEFKLASFLKGWLSYSRLTGVARKGPESVNRPSRFGLQCLGGRPRMIQLQG